MTWTCGKFITTWPEPPRNEFDNPYSDVVYFVSGGGLTKIGRTSQLRRRVTELAAACPMPLLLEAWLPGYSLLEVRLHARFDRYRVHGEWFRQNVSLRALLNKIEAAKTNIERLTELAGSIQ